MAVVVVVVEIDCNFVVSITRAEGMFDRRGVRYSSS
jgi:hypothetical protein